MFCFSWLIFAPNENWNQTWKKWQYQNNIVIYVNLLNSSWAHLLSKPFIIYSIYHTSNDNLKQAFDKILFRRWWLSPVISEYHITMFYQKKKLYSSWIIWLINSQRTLKDFLFSRTNDIFRNPTKNKMKACTHEKDTFTCFLNFIYTFKKIVGIPHNNVI